MRALPDRWLPANHPDFTGPALIDTHVWLWYLESTGGRMSRDAVQLLRRCVQGEGLMVSDISVWEVGTKARKGHLTLMPSVAAWIDAASRRPGLTFLPLDRQVLLGSTELPGPIHGDPADRMLIASAALGALPLLTADPAILDYAESKGGFSACDVRG